MTSRADAPQRLGAARGKALLRIARTTLRSWLEAGELPPGSPHDALLLRPRAAAVRLNLGAEPPVEAGSLRTTLPLFCAVQHAAIAAADAARWHRSLHHDDLASLRIEVLVPRTVCTLLPGTRFLPGRHGLEAVAAGRAALVWPDVAPRLGLDAPALLALALQRVGVMPSAWDLPEVRAEVRISAFTAELFIETAAHSGAASSTDSSLAPGSYRRLT